MHLGIYESLITKALEIKLKSLDKNQFYIADDTKLDTEEAIYFLSKHLSTAISKAFPIIRVEKKDMLLEKQIEITNNILRYLHQEIRQYNFEDDLVNSHGYILTGVLDQLQTQYTDLKLHLKQITPLTRLTQSELFTGGNGGLSLDSELKKEILSADRIDLLVSFIKWKAIVILKDAFEEFVNRGGKLRIITTTYMGATDAKAIRELAKLKNAEIKVSYNIANERLHAKAYLFHRNSGFSTGYIGSSNFSRSALTDGLEWNVKVTTQEIPHIISKFKKTFESYWNISEFELYDDERHFKDLSEALQRNKIGKSTDEFVQFFDIKPYHFQAEILEKLKVERNVHGNFKNLVVAATGTGKTMISAFDFKNHLKDHPEASLLFIAHRIEILKQSMHTFRNVLRDQNFGDILADGFEITDKRFVFATIQKLHSQIKQDNFPSDYYDFIVMDEVHHAQANTYQTVLHHFKPKILLGLTATPERMDGLNILEDFNRRIAAEIRLPDALNHKLLCPFQYFAVSDSINLSDVKWQNGRYDIRELTKIYTASDLRVRDIIYNLDKYTKSIHEVTALGFCVSKEHAEFMHQKFEKTGLKSAVLTSDHSANRSQLINQLRTKKINYLFVVDIFNEGIDVPEIDTVLFLRPTESLTIFLQQLGRGLRLLEGKEVLTVLDFVGNGRSEYDFEQKFRALIGKTNTTVLKEIEQDFPHLPLGCSIILEKTTKEIILQNIRNATSLSRRNLIVKIQNYQHQTDLPLTLRNFLSFYHLNLNDIYKRDSFSILVAEAFAKTIDLENSDKYRSMFANKWMVTNALSYFQFILKLINADFDINKLPDTEEHQLMATMLHYDFHQNKAENITLIESIKNIGLNKDFVEEMKEYLKYKIDQIDFEEIPCVDLDYSLPLRLHARYTRDQILVAFRLSTLEKKSFNREGLAENKDLKTELLFVNLKKSEEDFSPTTMYDDYAINDSLFHWQSQNQTADSSPKGISYINHQKINKTILLFIRESKRDINGNTQGYVFIGPAQFVKSEGSRPMSITWKLEEPLPNYLWKESAKMLIG